MEILRLLKTRALKWSVQKNSKDNKIIVSTVIWTCPFASLSNPRIDLNTQFIAELLRLVSYLEDKAGHCHLLAEPL